MKRLILVLSAVLCLLWLSTALLAVNYSGGGSAHDRATDASVAIDYEHHAIHEGDSYTCFYDQEVSDDNYRTAIEFTTPPDATWCHVTMHVVTTDETMIYVYEGVTTDANEATDLTVFNRDRNSANTTSVIGNDGTTGNASSWTEAALALAKLDTGTTVYSETLSVATGPGGKTAGGAHRSENEWILRQNTKYLFVIQSTDADDNTHHIHLNWYEHTNL